VAPVNPKSPGSYGLTIISGGSSGGAPGLGLTGATRPPRPETPPVIEIPAALSLQPEPLARLRQMAMARPRSGAVCRLQAHHSHQPASTLFPIPFSTGKCAEFPAALEAATPAAFPAPAPDVFPQQLLPARVPQQIGWSAPRRE